MSSNNTAIHRVSSGDPARDLRDEQALASYQESAKIDVHLQYLNNNEFNIYIKETGTTTPIVYWKVSKLLAKSAKIERVFPSVDEENLNTTWLLYRMKCSVETLESTTTHQTSAEAAFELFGYLANKEDKWITQLILELHHFRGKVELTQALKPRGRIVLLDCMEMVPVVSFFERIEVPPQELVVELKEYDERARQYPIGRLLQIPVVLATKVFAVRFSGRDVILANGVLQNR